MRNPVSGRRKTSNFVMIMLFDSTSSTLKKFLNVFQFYQRVIREIIIFGQNSFVLGPMGSINKYQLTGIQTFTSDSYALWLLCILGIL